MQKIMLEILPDGSIGARYAFNTVAPIPAQPVPPGSTLAEFALSGQDPEQRQRILAARARPQAYVMQGGRLRERGNEGRIR